MPESCNEKSTLVNHDSVEITAEEPIEKSVSLEILNPSPLNSKQTLPNVPKNVRKELKKRNTNSLYL